MKNQSHQTPASTVISASSNTTTLHQLVNKLQLSLLSQTTAKKSFIINNVDKSVSVLADENALAYVIGSLISNAVYSTSNSCIRIETVCVADRLQIRIRNNSSLVYSSHIHIPGNFVEAAEKIGGDIGIETEGKRAITLVFSLAKKAA
ncbi:MAG: sensor histidine kinase [Bacteroidota bacterium]